MIFLKRLVVVLLLVNTFFILKPEIAFGDEQCGGAVVQVVNNCDPNDDGVCNPSTFPYPYDCFPFEGVCSGVTSLTTCIQRSNFCETVEQTGVTIPCGAGGGDQSDDWIVGNVDGYSCTNRTISGWAVRGSGDAAINASVWINAIQSPYKAPAGDWVYSVDADGNLNGKPHLLTNVPRDDINTYYGITGNHGFIFDFPPEWIDGLSRDVKVYGSGSKKLLGQELWNSPITIACLPTTTNLAYSCAASGTSVDLSWNAITGASGYMVRLNKDPLSVWGGCPAAGCDPNDIAPVVNTNSTTFTITPDTDYQFSIQGTKPGESYPFSGCITPFTSGSASLPMA